ncbi:MAG: CerR family C-terminal domain-containing protein [Bryobacteraceae bacterium]|jgi:AcrR family transcriptional regulator
MSHPDTDATQVRLIEAAGEIFADHGYQSATVRDICARAGANIAAVNYYFGDKLGLYVAVLRHVIGSSEREELLSPADGLDQPREALRQFITRMLLHTCVVGERRAWHFRIMAHEMAQPTEALPRVVEEIIGPRYAAIRRIISAIIGLPPDHDTTRLCAGSVIGQVLHYVHARPVIACLWPDLKFTPERVERIADHIADFSLCALRAIAAKQTERTTHE